MAVVRGLDPPRDLTIPLAGSRTARDLLSLALRRLPADVRAMTVSPDLPRTHVRALDTVRRAMDGVLARDPGALFNILRRPSVGALLRVARVRGRTDALPPFLATFAAELALAGALDDAVVVPQRIASVVLPGLGVQLRLPRSSREVRIEPDAIVTGDGVRITLDAIAGNAAASPWADVRAGVPPLVRIDHNPLASARGQLGNAVDLGDRPAHAWLDAIETALGVIRTHLPDLAAEFDLYIQQLVPIGVQAERHRSASFHEAIGTIYLGLHANTMTMVEALVHEFSHNKLHALMELDPVLENMNALGFRSPLRDDPRPLRGVLLALHAFLPVAHLYRHMLDADDPSSRGPYFRERYARILTINREGADVVFAHARPTVVGAGLLDEMRRWMTDFDGVTQPK